MRDIVTRVDPCGYLLALICLSVIARKAGQRLPRFANSMWYAGTTVTIITASWCYVELLPNKFDLVVSIIIIAGIAGSATAIATALVMAPLATFQDRVNEEERKRLEEEHRADESRRQAESERLKAEVEIARIRAEQAQRRSVPPPPTRNQIAQTIRTRYEETIRMIDAAGLDADESGAAKETAKQKYLKELGGLMQ